MSAVTSLTGHLRWLKDLVHYIARHCHFVIYVWFYGTSITSHHIVLFFICFVKTLCVVNHYLSLCDTCVHMLKPTHGEQRDFVTDEMQQGSSSVMLQRHLGACCFIICWKEREDLLRKKKPDSLIWAFQSKHTTFINAATRTLK